jgi:hypothetical protein
MKTLKSDKPVAKCFDYEDGRTTQTAFIDGYSFGDRLLEGVMVRCFLDEKGFLEVSFLEEDIPYLSQLNEDYWLEAALESAKGRDIFCEKEDGDGGEELCFVLLEGAE